MDEDEGKMFFCTECGQLCSEEEWNDGDICDSCIDEDEGSCA